MAIENDDKVEIEVPDEEDLSKLDDATDWKVKAEEIQRKHRDAGIRNRERTKVLKQTIAERDAKLAEFLTAKSPEPKEVKPDDKLLKKLNTALMRSYGYVEADEVEIVEKWQKETGKDVEELLSHQYLSQGLKGEIEALRTQKTNDAATKNIQGGTGRGTDIKSDPNYWIQKNESPPNTPEYRGIREKMRKILSEKEIGMKSL